MNIAKNDYKILKYLEQKPNSNFNEIEKSLKNVASIKDRIETLHKSGLIDSKIRETSIFKQKTFATDKFAVSKLGAKELQNYRDERNKSIFKTIFLSLICPIIVAFITSLITILLTN